MTPERESGLDIFREPAARTYLVIGCAALLMYYAQMVERGGETGTLLVLIIAIPGLFARWTIAPVLFLIMTTYLFYDPNFGRLLGNDGSGFVYVDWGRSRAFAAPEIDDILLSAAVLIYLIAQFRLLSLMHKGLPDDPPPRRKGQPEASKPRRPPELYSDAEIGIVLGVAPVCVLAGLCIWLLLVNYEDGQRLSRSWGIEQPFARLMLFLWSLLTTIMTARVIFGYLALRRMSPRQARLMLQDSFWSETRREHERIYRWRNWMNERLPDGHLREGK